MNLLAKPIVKNKYWIVEDEGNKIGTILAIDEGGFSYVHDNTRERFPTIKLLSKKYNIIFDNSRQPKTKPTHECYGYPCSSKPYNQVWDVHRRLPIYSKQLKSKSFYCSGYYLIRFNNSWIREFCPKSILINRYEFCGPYKTIQECDEKYQELQQWNS